MMMSGAMATMGDLQDDRVRKQTDLDEAALHEHEGNGHPRITASTKARK
jgi:hypothetical protein